MLEIDHKHHFQLPHLPHLSRSQMQLSPVPVIDDGDEGFGDNEQDNNWELTERPDEASLEAFWSNVEADISRDPTWNTFAD